MYSIVIPAYNEEKRIEKALKDYSSYMTKNKFDYEIIVISDGSADSTPKIVGKMAQKNSKIRLIEARERLGKGRAVVEGLKSCKGDRVGFVDADEPITPDEYLKLFGQLETYDCVVASRRASGTVISIRQPFRRRAASKAFNLIVNALFGLGIRDTQCGAKVFRKKAVKKILGDMRLRGFEFDVELLWRIKKSGSKIYEMPVTWKHGEYSTFSLKYGPKMVTNLVRLRVGAI